MRPVKLAEAKRLSSVTTAPTCEPLIALLDLQPIERGVFLGAPEQSERDRVFGGQLVAQALAAACFSVDGWACHSVHAHFLRPGLVGRPIHYEVEALRDARRLATRQVRAVQRDELIINLTASFQADDGAGPEYQAPAPSVPGPDDVADHFAARAKLPEHAPPEISQQLRDSFPVEVRFVERPDWLAPKSADPAPHHVWLRTAGTLPDFPNLHRCALAFMSDLIALHGCMLATGRSVFDPALQIASLDHSLWFHRPLRADQWLLCTLEASSVSHGRGVGRGVFHDAQGRLVASMAQEALIYERQR